MCRAVLRRRGGGEPGERAHRFPPAHQPSRPQRGASGRATRTSHHLPELLPLLLGSGKVERKGDCERGQQRAERDRGATLGGQKQGVYRDQWEQ